MDLVNEIDRGNSSKNTLENNDGIDSITMNKNDKGRWYKIRLMYLINFLEIVAWATSFITLWPYILALDPSATVLFLTLVNFSRGVFESISSLSFGYWFDSRGPNQPLILCNVLFISGNLLYAFAGNFGQKGLWVILVSRATLGISGGAITIGRSVATELCRKDELTEVMSYFGLGEMLALFFAPLLQLFNLFVIGEKGFSINQLGIHFNSYTSSAWFLVVLGVINFLLQAKYFYRDYKQYRVKDESTEARKMDGTYRVDKFALIVLLLIHSIIFMAVSLAETTSPYLKDYFALTKQQFIMYSCVIALSYSFLSTITYAVIPILSKKFNDKYLLFYGLICSSIVIALFIPFGPGKIKVSSPIGIGTNGTSIGCPYKYDWCHDSLALTVPQVIVALVISSIGDPIAFALSNSVYASILGPVNQGRYMGFLTMTEPISKVFTPLISGPMYRRYGLKGPYLLMFSAIVAAIISYVLVWKRVETYDEKRSSYELVEQDSDCK